MGSIAKRCRAMIRIRVKSGSAGVVLRSKTRFHRPVPNFGHVLASGDSISHGILWDLPWHALLQHGGARLSITMAYGMGWQRNRFRACFEDGPKRIYGDEASGYYISEEDVWRPGAYASFSAAEAAFDLPDEVLSAIQKRKILRGDGGGITLADLQCQARSRPWDCSAP